MEKQVESTNSTPEVSIRVHGELELKGSDELEVVARADSAEDLHMDRDGDQVNIECSSNCSIRVPSEASIHIDSVDGNAMIKALDGVLEIGKISGNLILRNVSSVRVGTVNGELSARHVEGELWLDTVSGNATLRDIQGPLKVDGKIKGNLSLDDIDSSADAETNGNITLRLDPAPGEKYEFEANGNLVCRLPEDTSAAIRIDRAASIRLNLRGVDTPSKADAPFDLRLGEAEAAISLSASGNVLLISQAPDWEMSDDFDAGFARDFVDMASDIGQQVMQQIDAQMEMLERQLDAQMENLDATLGAAGFTSEAAERISRQARDASARATARAQEKMHRAQERIQRKMESVQRRAEQRARSEERRSQNREKRSWGFEWPGSRPEASSEPVSDEERLVILKMLEEKKISVEEAEQLLSALEGKGGA